MHPHPPIPWLICVLSGPKCRINLCFCLDVTGHTLGA